MHSFNGRYFMHIAFGDICFNCSIFNFYVIKPGCKLEWDYLLYL